jgi:hypothetical protein
MELLVDPAETDLVDELYIGHLETYQPPGPVRERFNGIHDQLCNHVRSRMKKSRNMTSVVLCMAGPLEGIQVRLRPIIWISCGDRKSRENIKRSLNDSMLFLTQFLRRFQMEQPHVSLNGPYPLMEIAGNAQEWIAARDSLEILDDPSSLDTVCGSKARFTMFARSIPQFQSTVGGLIVIGGELFAMTAGHGIVKKLEEKLLDKDQYTWYREKTDDAPHGESLGGFWKESKFPTVFAYLDYAVVEGSRVSSNLVDATDFALVDPATFTKLSNRYRYQWKAIDIVETVSDHVPVSELSAGDVWVLTRRDKSSEKGYMIEGDASIIVRDAVIRTKMIKLTTDIGMSLHIR